MADPREEFTLTVAQDGLQLRQLSPHFVLNCNDPNYSSGSFSLYRENDVEVTGTYTRVVFPGDGESARAAAARKPKRRPARKAAKKSAAKKATKKGARKASKKSSKPKRRR